MVRPLFHLTPWITSKENMTVLPGLAYITLDFPESRAHRYSCLLICVTAVRVGRLPNPLQRDLASYFTTNTTPIMDLPISLLILSFTKGRNIQRASIFSNRSSSRHIDRISQSTFVRALKGLVSLFQRLGASNLKQEPIGRK